MRFGAGMLTPYGHDNAFLMLGIGVCLVLLSFTVPGPFFSTALIVLGCVVIAFTMWFFRDADRPLAAEAADPSVIVSPADGAVTEVVSLDTHPDLNCPSTRVTIFLSPVNLHVNRYPASGEIVDARYVAGKYLMAFNPKASEENERSEFVLRTPFGRIAYTQITGFLARRIVYDTKKGDVVRAGERFGMMKFGSRMDIVVPATAQIAVKVGDKVVSARSIIARLHTDGVAA